jgi:quinol monooxygenase YgiN
MTFERSGVRHRAAGPASLAARPEERALHARIGTFSAPPDRVPEVIAHFRDRVVPRFRKHAGFLGYRAYADAARGRIVGISLWETRAALDSSVETARTALREAREMGAETLGEPEILELAFDLPGALGGGR